jgi:1,4-alpha-glucan branching enzyme
MIAFPGKKCLFMGNEYGQNGYWDYTKPLNFITNDDEKYMSWFTQNINKFYLNTPELYEWDYSPEGTQVIENNHAGQVLCLMRHCSKGSLMCMFNFSDNDYYNYKIDNCNWYSHIEQVFSSKYAHESNPHLDKDKLVFNLPAHSAFFYRVKN